MKSATMRYFDSGVISHEICNHEIQDIGHTSTDMIYWILSFSKAIKLKRSVQSTHKSKKPIQINQINQ